MNSNETLARTNEGTKHPRVRYGPALDTKSARKRLQPQLVRCGVLSSRLSILSGGIGAYNRTPMSGPSGYSSFQREFRERTFVDFTIRHRNSFGPAFGEPIESAIDLSVELRTPP